MRSQHSYTKVFILLCLLLFSHCAFSNTLQMLDSPQAMAKAETYYIKHIYRDPSEQKQSALETLEQKMLIKQAIQAQDWDSARYRLKRLLGYDKKDFQTWFLFSRTLVEDFYGSHNDAVVTALTYAFNTAQTQLDKSAVLWLASTLRAFETLRQSALSLAKQEDIEQRTNVLYTTYPQEFAPYSLNLPERTDMATACISWTYPLEKGIQYNQYITLDPQVHDLSVVAKGNQLCLEGFNFGEHYKLSFKKGLPGKQEKALAEPQSLSLFVPHRKPTLSFREKGYILAAHGPQIVPITTVNIQDIHVKIIHIPERNIPSVQHNWFSNRLSVWNSEDLTDNHGDVIWQGKYHFPNEIDKTTLSGLPIDQMIGNKLQPGLYVVEARMSEDSDNSDSFSSQALVVSDIGLSTYHGPEGLHVFTRSFHSAKPMADVQLTLVARNNKELAHSNTNHKGESFFSKQIMNGKGGNAPTYLIASKENKQFNILKLRSEAFTLETGVAQQRQRADHLDGLLFSERGIYRPGETVHLMSLLRNKQGKAETDLPLTLKITRPDGVLALEKVLQDAGNGAYIIEYPINAAAPTGLWNATISLASKEANIARTTFEVNDFVPPRIEVTTSSEQRTIEPYQPHTIKLYARYYFGPHGDNLKVDANSQLSVAKNYFPAFKEYYFGLEDEPWIPLKLTPSSAQTDAQGQAIITTQVELQPQTTHLLELETTAMVHEIGGRAREAKHTIPLWHQPYVIGIAPQFDSRTAPHAKEAKFNLIALNQKGELQAKDNLRYNLYQEHPDFVWFRSGSHWQYETITRDHLYSNGKITLTAHAPTLFAISLKYGQYRLEIIDDKTGVASSVRFSVGWFHATANTDKPDLLDVSIKPNVNKGAKTAHVKINSPFDGELSLAWASDQFIPIHNRTIKKGNIEFEIPVHKEIAQKASSYLIATLYRSGEVQSSQMPGRAIGLAWFDNKDIAEQHKIELSLDVPAQIKSGQTVEITLSNKQKSNNLRVAVALVDEATLSLVNYKTPDPFNFFFSQPQLNYAVRDNYGLLINPFGARPGSFEVGGGEDLTKSALSKLPARAHRVVSLHSGIIDAHNQDTIRVPFTLPEYTGKLRVMAIAWDETGVGHAETFITVKEDFDLYLTLPRFLAPEDKATIPLVIKNNTDQSGEYTLEVQSSTGKHQRMITLDKGSEKRIPVSLEYSDLGIKNITTTLKSPNDVNQTRHWQLSVRPTRHPIAIQQYGALKPNEEWAMRSDLLNNFHPERSAVKLSIATTPEWGGNALIEQLLSYPYHCLEQTSSRLLAAVYQQSSNQPINIDKETNQLASLQKIDGSLSLWAVGGSTNPWLTLYAADILQIAQDKKAKVPEALKANLYEWVKNATQRNIYGEKDLSIVSYAYYLCAKTQQGSLRELQFFVDNNQKALISRHDLAFIGAAFAYYGDPSMAKHWFDKAASASFISEQTQWGIGSELRNTAILVSLLAETTHDQSTFMRLANELLDKAKHAYYLSTQEKAWLIRAEQGLKALNKAYHFTLGKQTVKNTTTFITSFKQANLLEPIVLKNQGDTPLYYAITVEGEPLNIDPLPQNGFTLTREIYNLEGKLADLTQLKSGEQYVIVIKGQRLKKELHHVLLVDLLPAGFEIDNAKLTNVPDRLSWLPTLTRASRLDGRDDRFVAAYELYQDYFIAAYTVRAISGGEFTYPAAYTEAMYQPEYFKYTNEQKIVINEDF